MAGRSTAGQIRHGESAVADRQWHPSHALLTSLAVDNGNNSRATAIGLLYDQSGADFGRIVDRNGTPETGFDIDIGAFELALSELFG